MRIHEPTRARVKVAVQAYGPEAQTKLNQRREARRAKASSSPASATVPSSRSASRKIPKSEARSDGPVDGLPRLLETVHRLPLLSVEVTVDQAKRVRAGAEAAHELNVARPGVDQRKLKRLVFCGMVAKESLIRHNLRLVLTIARRYGWSTLPLDDRFQHGAIGLMRAVEKYDHRLGYRLSTYATWWIHQAIVRGIDLEDSAIRLPSHVWERIRTLSRIERSRELQGLAVDLSSLVVATGWNSSRLAEVRLAKSRAQMDLVDHSSLKRMVDELGAEPDHCEAVIDGMFSELIVEALDRLTARERKIIYWRFGLNDGHARTLEDIGQELGLTRERIRQIVRSAIERLELFLIPFLDAELSQEDETESLSGVAEGSENNT